jgi:hypothetical protein
MEQALLAVGAASVLAVVTTAALAALVVRGLRRRYRAVHARLRSLTVLQPGSGGTSRAPSAVAAATIGSAGWWAAQNRRHRMWKAVSSAEHAVAVARRADVAVGDLPALTAQLSTAARGVDSVLRAGGRLGSLSHEDRASCDRIEAAASDIRAAALSSLRSAAHADTDPVLSAVQIEVAALAAGVRAAHQ